MKKCYFGPDVLWVVAWIPSDEKVNASDCWIPFKNRKDAREHLRWHKQLWPEDKARIVRYEK